MPAPDILPIEELPVASITLLEGKRHSGKNFLTFAFGFASFFFFLNLRIVSSTTLEFNKCYYVIEF